MCQLILASNSPRRARLLAAAGYEFRVRPAELSEPALTDQALDPVHVAEALAYFKARQIVQQHPQAVVLGADTVVALGDEIFGKAEHEDHARQILSALAASRHQVITGVAVICLSIPKRLIAHQRTGIVMRPMTDQALEQYIRTGAWRDKAGAYAVQEDGDAYIERIDGSFSNVVGLPMELTERMLRGFGIHPKDDLPPCPARL